MTDDKSQNPDWNSGYEAGFADGVNDAAPDLIEAARAALYWFEPNGDPSFKRPSGADLLADDVISALKRALANLGDAS